MESANEFVIEHPTAMIGVVALLIAVIVLLYLGFIPLSANEGLAGRKKKRRAAAKSADTEDSESEVDELIDSINSKQKSN